MLYVLAVEYSSLFSLLISDVSVKIIYIINIFFTHSDTFDDEFGNKEIVFG